MKENQNANMSREEYNNVTSKQNANTAYNGNELYDKGIVRGKIFILPEEMREERLTVELLDGYQFKDENGNVINATKIVLEKKPPRTDGIIKWLRERDMTKYIRVLYSGMCSITFDTEELIKDITEMIGD